MVVSFDPLDVHNKVFCRVLFYDTFVDVRQEDELCVFPFNFLSTSSTPASCLIIIMSVSVNSASLGAL